VASTNSFPLPAAEDRDLCERWTECGGDLRFMPEAAVDHLHEMTLSSFLRQQYRYGQGALVLKHKRAARGINFRLEPSTFYFGLFAEPFRSRSLRTAASLFALLFLSQLANVTGFFVETFRRPRGRKK
jgi:cellulose synthase/poly-beta-1,6-N-acetylglucosamine synthase-like glycosyltransferase